MHIGKDANNAAELPEKDGQAAAKGTEAEAAADCDAPEADEHNSDYYSLALRSPSYIGSFSRHFLKLSADFLIKGRGTCLASLHHSHLACQKS